MTPSNSINYTTNATTCYAYDASYGVLGFTFFMKSANLHNSFSIYDSSWICFASSFSSFLRRVSAVVSVCSKKKVIGIYARRVVALVKNMQLFWKMSVINYPSNSGRYFAFGFPRGKDSVSILGFESRPIPAGVCFVNESIKPFVFQCSFSIPAAPLRTIWPSARFYCAWSFVKLCFAGFADKLHNDDSSIMETSLSTP